MITKIIEVVMTEDGAYIKKEKDIQYILAQIKKLKAEGHLIDCPNNNDNI